VGIAAGVPAIEICRLAERRQADLLVLGRKQRSQLGRLLLGDTADAVPGGAGSRVSSCRPTVALSVKS